MTKFFVSGWLVLAGLLVLVAQAHAAEPAVLKTGVQNLPGAWPKSAGKDAAQGWDFDLSREKFYIYVPENYKGNPPFGILVYLSPSDESIGVPPGWDRVLQEKNLLYIAPQNAGNQQATSRRAGLAVVAAFKLQEMARVDTNRVYVAGLSGGARVASFVSFIRPEIFSGVVAICGVNFPRKVPRVRATMGDEYGYFELDEQNAAEAKKRVRFVLITGTKDFRYGNLQDLFTGGFQKEGYAAEFMDVPGMGHTLCAPKELRQALAFIEKRPEAEPDTNASGAAKNRGKQP